MNEFDKKLDTIGQRAAWAIDERCLKNRGSKAQEYGKVDVTYLTMSNWRKGKTDPRGYHLQQMALQGYDIFWILTGVRNGRKGQE